MNSPFDGFVAVVDDDPSVRRALTRLLRSVGVPCLTHDSGSEFLASPKLHDFDCLILDVHMPELTGIEACRQMLTIVKRLPCILMLGDRSRGLRDEALEAGAAELLEKPVDGRRLVTLLHELMSTRW